MRKIIKTVLALALILATLCSSALAASYGAKVLVNNMSVYNSEKEVAGSLDQGTSIKVTAMSGDWVRISYKGKTGYVNGEYVTEYEEVDHSANATAVEIAEYAMEFLGYPYTHGSGYIKKYLRIRLFFIRTVDMIVSLSKKIHRILRNKMLFPVYQYVTRSFRHVFDDGNIGIFSSYRI